MASNKSRHLSDSVYENDTKREKLESVIDLIKLKYLFTSSEKSEISFLYYLTSYSFGVPSAHLHMIQLMP